MQYAPGTQVNCSGLLGLLGCLVNDVLKLGGTILSDLPLVNGLVAVLDGNGIVNLSNQSNVVYISLDRPLSPTLSNAAPAVNAFAAWQSGYTGAGIGVALVDSGISSHPDLNGGSWGSSRVVWNQSFVPGNASANDQYGHGTHIAGLIAGNGASSTGAQYSKTFEGIAPKATLVNLRVLDQNGVGTDSEVIAAINTAISLKSKFNIRVINLSMGRPVYESYKMDPLCHAVEAAWKSGIVVVVAAGNNGRYQPTNGYGTITSPGNDPYVITVGAMKPMGTPTRVDDLIASYSSKGPTAIDAIAKPDLVAPGNLAGFTGGSRFNSLCKLSRQSGSLQLLRERGNECTVLQLFHAERHQHGQRCSERNCRRPAAEKSEPQSRSGKSAPHEDGMEVVAGLSAAPPIRPPGSPTPTNMTYSRSAPDTSTRRPRSTAPTSRRGTQCLQWRRLTEPPTASI